MLTENPTVFDENVNEDFKRELKQVMDLPMDEESERIIVEIAKIIGVESDALFNVIMENAGENDKELVRILVEMQGYLIGYAADLLEILPGSVAVGPQEHAEEVARRLREAGATVEVRPYAPYG